MRRQASVALVIVFLLIAAGCDSFSLLDQFQKGLDNGLGLSMEKSSVKPGEVSALYPSGGTAPYTFAVIADSLYDDGVHATDTGTIANQNYTAGNSIGTVKVRVTDSTGKSAESVITILPWGPENFSWTVLTEALMISHCPGRTHFPDISAGSG